MYSLAWAQIWPPSNDVFDQLPCVFVQFLPLVKSAPRIPARRFWPAHVVGHRGPDQEAAEGQLPGHRWC